MTSNLNFYFTLLQKIKEGKKPIDISKEMKKSKQSISYYTRRLRDLGFVEKKGYGVWEVKRSKREDLEHALNKKDKKIRGHAFIWKCKFDRNYNWKNILEDRKINYKLVRGYIPRLFIGNKKVWLSKNTVIIYENKSFYGKNAVESRKYAVYELLKTVRELSKKLKINLRKPYFRPTRAHYGMIKNELARQCNDKGEKIIIRDDLDGEWLWVDDSKGMLGELETGGKGFTKDRAALNLNVQKWYNDHKRNNFKVTPSFILESLDKVANNQRMYSDNIESHINAINKLGNSAEENARTTQMLSNMLKEMKQSFEKREELLLEEIKKIKKEMKNGK